MPISGLTNPPKSFLKIGQIRKGEMKEFTRRDGSKYSAPVDLDHFRVTFRPDEKECAEEFMRVYGDAPRRINIRFPFKTIEENWDANYECYSKGGLIAKAGSNENGLYWIFYRNHSDGEVLVRNGMPVGSDGRDFFEKPIDVGAPVYSYIDKKGNSVLVYLEPVGRLQVVVPEIAHLRVGYLEFRPGSPKDIAAISRELAAIEMLARQAGRDLSGIPLALTRREETITKNLNGQLSQGQSWLVHIELIGAWGQKALDVLERNSVPEIVEAEVRELGMEEQWDGDLSENIAIETEPPVSPKPTAPAPAKPSAPAPESLKNNSQRPYDPETFKSKYLDLIANIVAKHDEEGTNCEVSDNQRKVLAAVLGKHCFKGNQFLRHEFMDWLCADPSTETITCEQAIALLRILKISGKDFNEKPDPIAIQEIIAAHAYAVKEITGK